MNKAKSEDVNMYKVGFRIYGILTDYAQKLLGHYCKPCGARGMIMHQKNECDGFITYAQKSKFERKKIKFGPPKKSIV